MLPGGVINLDALRLLPAAIDFVLTLREGEEAHSCDLSRSVDVD